MDNNSRKILLNEKWQVIFCLVFVLISIIKISAQDASIYVSDKPGKGKFTLSFQGNSAPIVISSQDYSGVKKVAQLFQKDISQVTNAMPELIYDQIPQSKEIIIVGTIEKSLLINQLISNKKLNVDELKGKWDAYLIQVVEKPFSNVDRALVIVGSNKRGAIYGMFDISYKIGVTPWNWWADVPAKKQQNIFINPIKYFSGEPKVKYRGIFINDEAPALSGFSKERFGGFNHKFYEHVFELILRLRGNFLWPAMWGSAFYDDDPENAKLADEYGVVISTSHHEPMMRAHDEWRRYGKNGAWDYEKNDSSLREFWREGIKRMGNNESVITLAMRGDGDEAMSPNANVSLLQKIVEDQRKIIGEVTGKDVTTVPQVWALYKEVQEYYEKGMKVPDDVTLLLCDDNWGNLRKLPKLADAPRKGGYGIYYHFDYVGGPRNYKWLNTNQISRVWEQMHLAYEYGARQIWVVNVGDIKPVEFPIEFFLDYAWDPDKINAEDLTNYSIRWAEKQFGKEHSKEIGYILDKYTEYNSRRKPELLSPDTYSIIDYREAEKVVEDYNKLVELAQKINLSIPLESRDAFFQLVLHPVLACANLNELYVSAAKNRLYAKQGRAATNYLANKVKYLFTKDSLISVKYNQIISGGKWIHMMDQTHIGYTNWQEPKQNNILKTEIIQLGEQADMGVAVEGSTNWWPFVKSIAMLPEFDSYNQQKYYVEIFNRGKTPFDFSIKADQSWINISEVAGTVETEKRIWLTVDWNQTPKGKNPVSITILGAGKSVLVQAMINNLGLAEKKTVRGFVESNGYISINANNYSKAVNDKQISWKVIPNLGREGSAVTSFPVTVTIDQITKTSPHLEYNLYFFNKGEIKVNTYLSPTLNFLGSATGLRYAISIDDEQPQIVNITSNPNPPDLNRDRVWNKWVADNINIQTTTHNINTSGNHVLKIWRLEPGVVLQKIVVETTGAKPSYLGPPQSYNNEIIRK